MKIVSKNPPELEKRILDNISKHITLDETESAIFLRLLERKSVRRKEFLLRDNEISKYLIFVANGCLRTYSIGRDGSEHILNFAPINWWCGDLYSFISGKRSNLFMEALTPTEIFQISKKSLDILYARVPKFERFFRILFQNAYIIHQNRINANLSLNALGRYKKFSKTYPDLEHIIAQKYIASYIGVTPEFFSELKRKVAQ